MIDFAYLYKGICGLSRAHQAGTMAGHLGAAVTAGYFLGEDLSDLPAEVFDGVEGELERIIAGEEAIWFNAKKAGITPTGLFEALPEEEPQLESIQSIADALDENAASLKQSGHNTIFASIAIRALQDHPDYATPAAVTGATKLIRAFNSVPAGRGYYGKDQGWKTGNQVKLAADNNFPMYRDLQEMVATTVAELIATASIKRQGFGGLWHIINHTAAITELDRYGYAALAEKAFPAHRQHIRLWRTLPDVADELGPVIKSEHDPRQPEYWDGMLKRDEARLTHRIKTLYGYYTIRRFIEDETTRAKADDALLYLMA